MVMIRIELDITFAEQFFGTLDIVSPVFEDDHGYDCAFLGPAHIPPVNRRSRVDDHEVFQAGHSFSGWNYIHKDWIGRNYTVERFTVGDLYLFLDVDRSPFLLDPIYDREQSGNHSSQHIPTRTITDFCDPAHMA